MNVGRVEYIHLPAGSPLPATSTQPRRVMVLIEEEVEPAWQEAVSRWIVESGCLSMMAWGQECSAWDDSVDYANLEQFNYGEIPDEEFVMTSWHEDEPLNEVFFFARMCAFHPTIDLPLLTILDIRKEARETAILSLHEAESSGLLDNILDDPRDLPFRERLKILLRMR